MTKPSPVVVTTICSLCDEPWEDHGDKPTAEDCVRLLKAKLAATPAPVTILTQPPIYPKPYPYWYYHQPTWTSCGSTTGGLTGSITSYDPDVQTTNTIEYRTPTTVEVSCTAA